MNRLACPRVVKPAVQTIKLARAGRFRQFSGNLRGSPIMKDVKSPVASFRSRKTLQGFVRIEVNVQREDAGLLRSVASALSDPVRQAEARILLRQNFAEFPGTSLKALLAAAPLDGIELDRDPRAGRDIDL